MLGSHFAFPNFQEEILFLAAQTTSMGPWDLGTGLMQLPQKRGKPVLSDERARAVRV